MNTGCPPCCAVRRRASPGTSRTSSRKTTMYLPDWAADAAARSGPVVGAMGPRESWHAVTARATAASVASFLIRAFSCEESGTGGWSGGYRAGGIRSSSCSQPGSGTGVGRGSARGANSKQKCGVLQQWLLPPSSVLAAPVATLLRQALPLPLAPLGDLPVVTGQQHLRDTVPAVVRRPRVARGAEPAVPEGIAPGTVEVRHRAGQEAHRGIDDRERGRLPAAQHEVAKRDLVGREVVGDALVDVLVMPAEKRHLLASGEPAGVGLAEDAS